MTLQGAAMVAIAFCGAFAAVPAHAVLGGDAATIGADHARLKGARRSPMTLATASASRVETHEIALADGSSIREYVSPAGVVFAVAWSTRFKPDLDALLGVHAALYAAAADAAMKAPGVRRRLSVQQGDLVVESSAHLNAFIGRAYLRSFTPDRFDFDAIR